MHRKIPFLDVLAAVFLAICAICCAAQTALDLKGEPLNPLQHAGGKVTVLIFVRTDCPISNRYAPAIQKLGTQYAGKAAFWLVYPDPATKPADVTEYAHAYGYTLPGLLDRQHALVAIAKAEITPEAAVFNARGDLVYHGRIDDWYEAFGRARPAPTTHELSDAIEAASAGRQPAIASAPAVGCYISDLK